MRWAKKWLESDWWSRSIGKLPKYVDYCWGPKGHTLGSGDLKPLFLWLESIIRCFLSVWKIVGHAILFRGNTKGLLHINVHFSLFWGDLGGTQTNGGAQIKVSDKQIGE